MGNSIFNLSYMLDFLKKFYLNQVLYSLKDRNYFKSLSREYLATEVHATKHFIGMQRACLTAMVRDSFSKTVNGKPITMLCISVLGTCVREHRTPRALKPRIYQAKKAQLRMAQPGSQ